MKKTISCSPLTPKSTNITVLDCFCFVNFAQSPDSNETHFSLDNSLLIESNSLKLKHLNDDLFVTSMQLVNSFHVDYCDVFLSAVWTLVLTAPIHKKNLTTWSHTHTHLRTWVHFLARHKICTNNYILLQFPKETNTRDSKTLSTSTWRISCYDFKTILKSWEIWKLMLLNFSITHIQLHIYGFS